MTARLLRVPMDGAAPGHPAVQEAAAALRAGGLVAFPTETVYGLGAHALDGDAVARAFAAKGRPLDNPVIVHLAGVGALPGVAAEVPPLARALAHHFWPGPLTLVLQAGAQVPAQTTAGLPTVAVRVPDHPVALALLAATGAPVAAPSANRSGRPSPTTAAHVLADLGAAIDVVVDGGPCRVGVESTVVDARGDQPVVLREGAITREQLAEVAAPADPRSRAALGASPGTRHAHYQPRCPVVVAPPGGGAVRACELADTGAVVALVATAPAPPPVRTVAVFADATELGQVLYAGLRAAEEAGADVVVVEAVEPTGIGRAVMDRLRRAAGG